MKFLADTNIIIPLEPTSPSDQEALTGSLTTLARLVSETGHVLYVHPASRRDLAKDTNVERQTLRYSLFQKYPQLPSLPAVSEELVATLGKPAIGTNDWIDHQILNALAVDAVDFLITEDRKLRNKARHLKFEHRVLGVNETVTLLYDLSEKISEAPPAVKATKAYNLDKHDPILDSFRQDYPRFDEWLQRASLEHRLTWTIEGHKSLAAFCVVNQEKQHPPKNINGKLLKICSFKVSENYNGFRYGELLLKTVFDHAFHNSYDWIFTTVYDKYQKLIQLLEELGFTRLDSYTHLGECILAKAVKPAPIFNTLPALDYHVKYGPHFFLTEGVSCYVVPIQPCYADLLFPEANPQQTMFAGTHSYGNAIRKAYLCHAGIRSIEPGSVLLFYRSGNGRGGVALGIAEDAVVSSSSEAIAKLVGKRTVYSFSDIERMSNKTVLSILFRQARSFLPPFSCDELVAGKIFTRPPQSIMKIGEEGTRWLQTKLKA